MLPRADLTSGVHDSVPCDATIVLKSPERVADLARMPRDAGQQRDLPVSGDTTARNSPNDNIDPLTLGQVQYRPV